jgi:PPIC-type PPIASE domain/SurA N-terminal domain
VTTSFRLFSRAVWPLVALALLLASCGTSSQPAHGAAATVGGSEISTDEVAKTASVLTAVSATSQQPCGQLDGDSDTQEAACNRYALSTLIQFRLSDSYAAAHDITVQDADVDKTYTGFEQSVGKEGLDTQLQANGVTPDDVKGLIHSSLVQNAVAKAVTEERLGDAGLRKQYQDSIAQYTTLHVDHILVNSEAEADDIYRQVTAPGFTLKDFQALAQERSIDPNAKQDGGELTQPASQLVAEFADAALALRPGEISKPVQTQFGWHVIWKIGETVQPYDQVKDQLLQSAEQQEFVAWMGEQAKGDQAVVVDPSFGRFDTEQLTVVRITSTDPSASSPTPTSAANAATPSP